jgi:peptidyl-prolyl cis-trans isomerase SurA
MSLRRSAASVLLSCVVVFVVNAQPDTDTPPTLFTISNNPVTTEEFIYLYRKNHQHKPEEFTKEKIEEYLELFINYKLKVEEAFSRGMDATAAFKKEYQTYRDELLKPYLPDTRIIDSLVKLTYERLKEEVNASHILVTLQPDASPADTLSAYKKIMDLRIRALAGEDFGELAKTNSEEPGAEMSEGNLGYFTAMQMVFPFEQAAYLTPVGGISTPVRTQFGYHIVKVIDRQPSRGEVEVSHIMIRESEGGESQEAKNTIFDIYDKLQKGMNWDELCRQYSQDPNSKNNGGRLRPFGVGAMAAVPEFQEMAFALKRPGEISDPIQTRYGWHILRLESTIPLPPLEELKPALTQRVTRDERVTISKEALRRQMRLRFGYVENSDVIEELISMTDTLLQKNSLAAKSVEGQVLFSMQNRPYDIKGFLDYVAEQPPPPGSASGEANLKQLITQYADAVQLSLMEEKVKRESPEYKWLLKEYYEGILLFEIMEKEVWNKAMEDSVGQRTYFLANSGKYLAGERLVGEIFSASSKAPLTEARKLIEADDPSIKELMTKQQIRRDSGSFEREDRGVLAGIPWEPGIYTTENNGVHYLINIESILPPGPETFEEARASLISDYQTHLEDSWIIELKRKFGVKVEKRAKKRAFAQLMDR